MNPPDDWGAPQPASLTATRAARVRALGGRAWPSAGVRSIPGIDLRLLALLLLAPATVSAAWWTMTSASVAEPELRAAYLAYSIVAPVLIGLWWWARRPDSRIGPVLVVYGYLAWAVSLQSVDEALPAAIGLAARAPFEFLMFYLALALPAVKRVPRLERVLLAAWAVVLAICWAPLLISFERLEVPGALSLPVLALRVGDVALLSIAVAGAGCALGVLVIQIARWFRAPTYARLASAPVVLASLLLFPSLAALMLAPVVLPDAGVGTSALALVVAAGRIALPLGFLVSLVIGALVSGGVYRTLAARMVSNHPGEPSVEGILRGVDDPSVLAAASAVARISTSNLQGLEAIELLRNRLIDATDLERQRILRDLHDGAQQRLVALRVKAGLAMERVDESSLEYAVLGRLAAELELASGELRDLARSLLAPPNSTGFASALRSITRHWPMTVRVREHVGSGYDDEVRATVYNCCLEALLNARAHAGTTAQAIVSVFETDGRLQFIVRDDAADFDGEVDRRHRGLARMTARTSLLGGQLSVGRSRRGGLTVHGFVPLSGEEP